jgi:hypothetical protein
MSNYRVLLREFKKDIIPQVIYDVHRGIINKNTKSFKT